MPATLKPALGLVAVILFLLAALSAAEPRVPGHAALLSLGLAFFAAAAVVA